MKTFESPADALNDLKKRGYEADFEPQSNCLYCSNLDLRLYEEEFHIDEVYHFKGNANPGNNTVVYALSSPTGLKGVIVDADKALSKNINSEISEAAKPSGDANS